MIKFEQREVAECAGLLEVLRRSAVPAIP